MTKEELAKWLHDNYEAVAKEQDWDTQQSCKVEFDTLPDANKRTMIEMADRLLNFNLLRLHFVSGQSELLIAFADWVFEQPKHLGGRERELVAEYLKAINSR